MMNELNLVGNVDDLYEFASDLQDAEGDLSLLIYRAAFGSPAAPRTAEEASKVQALAGPSVLVKLPKEFDVDDDGDGATLR